MVMTVCSCVVLTLVVSHETGTKTPPAKAARPEKKGEGDWYLYDFFMLYSFKVKPTVPFKEYWQIETKAIQYKRMRALKD